MPEPPHYPWFVVITHALNIFFLLMLGRSGIEVLSSFPKLYWNDGCPPGREWARFSKRSYGGTRDGRGSRWTKRSRGTRCWRCPGARTSGSGGTGTS